MRSWLGKNWPWLLTAIVIAVAALLAIQYRKLDDLDHIGSFIAGFSGALAFIWLVAAYLLQNQELKLQRGELALQRASLDAQREELRRMGKFAALEQISNLLSQYEASLEKSPEGAPKTVQELPMALANAMTTWNEILQADDHARVHELHIKWQLVLASCEEFLNRVVSAIELYQEATSEQLLVQGENSAIRIYVSIHQIRNIPFIRNYIGTAEMLATSLFMFEPGLDAIALKGFEATEALMPGVVKAGHLEELRRKVAEHQQRREQNPQL